MDNMSYILDITNDRDIQKQIRDSHKKEAVESMYEILNFYI